MQTKRNRVPILAAATNTAFAAICAALSFSAPAAAGSHKLVPPDHKFGGITAGEAHGEGLSRLLSLPAAENPLFGNGDPCLRLGHKQRVLRPIGSPACTVPEGTAIAVLGNSSFCDDVEPAPYYGADEAAQRRCAVDSLAPYVQSITVSVDDRAPTDIHLPRYETFTPQRSVQLLEDNFLGVPPGPATFTAWGWLAWLTKLAPGTHTIRSVTAFTDGFEQVREPTITVTAKRDGDPTADGS